MKNQRPHKFTTCVKVKEEGNVERVKTFFGSMTKLAYKPHFNIALMTVISPIMRVKLVS